MSHKITELRNRLSELARELRFTVGWVRVCGQTATIPLSKFYRGQKLTLDAIASSAAAKLKASGWDLQVQPASKYDRERLIKVFLPDQPVEPQLLYAPCKSCNCGEALKDFTVRVSKETEGCTTTVAYGCCTAACMDALYESLTEHAEDPRY